MPVSPVCVAEAGGVGKAFHAALLLRAALHGAHVPASVASLPLDSAAVTCFSAGPGASHLPANVANSVTTTLGSLLSRLLTTETLSRYQAALEADTKCMAGMRRLIQKLLLAGLEELHRWQQQQQQQQQQPSSSAGSAGSVLRCRWAVVTNSLTVAGAAWPVQLLPGLLMEQGGSLFQILATIMGLLPRQPSPGLSVEDHRQLLSAGLVAWGQALSAGLAAWGQALVAAHAATNSAGEQRMPAVVQQHALRLLPTAAQLAYQLALPQAAGAAPAVLPSRLLDAVGSALAAALMAELPAPRSILELQPQARPLALVGGARAALLLLNVAAQQCVAAGPPPLEAGRPSQPAAIAGECLGAARCFLAMLCNLCAAGGPQIRAGQGSPGSLTNFLPEAACELRQLHAATCRLVHFAAAATEQLRAAVPARQQGRDQCPRVLRRWMLAVPRLRGQRLHLVSQTHRWPCQLRWRQRPVR